MDVLISKLIPPKRRDVIHRKRLIRLFEEMTDKKLFTVTAGAGFGKTTLVVDALNRQKVLPIWYRLDEQDTDFHVFMAYLYSAVRRQCNVVPQPDEQAGRRLSGLKDQTAILTEWLAFAQKWILQPAAIILDDYHLVQDSQPVNEAVDFILHRLPVSLQLIVIGRKKLPLRLSRLRVQEELVEITEDDLCFSDREIRSFFDYQVHITQPDVKQIVEITRGWAASLVLLRYALSKKKDSPAVSDSLAKFKKRPDFIFSYLKENIFDTQPEHTRRFLMKAALLPEIDIRLCKTIFHVGDADRILSRMIDNHLLIFPVDESGEVFYLHHLFRDFLMTQLHQQFPVDEIERLHCRIGKEMESHDIYLAIHHFVEGMHYENAIRIIKNHELDFLLHGKVNFLDRYLSRIPKPEIEKNPEILLIQSRICSHFGNPEKGIELTSKALKIYQDQKATEKTANCVIELGMQYYFTGHLKEAKLMLEQVLGSIEKESQAYVIAMTFLTFLPSVIGEFETSRKNDREARITIADYPEDIRKVATALLDTSFVHTLFFSGEFGYSQQVSRQLLKTVVDLNIEPCLPLVYYQLSVNCFYLGEWENGCDYAKKGIDACEKMSLSDSRKGWVYLAWAQNCLGQKQLEEAHRKLARSIQLFESPGNRWGMASAWDCLAAIYLEQNQPRPALETLKKALDLIKGYGLNVTRSLLENSMANVMQADGKYRLSLEHLSRSRPNLKGASYHLFNNHLLTARAYCKLENTKEAASHLSRALELAKAFSYSRFVIENNDWIIPLISLSRDRKDLFSTECRTYAETLFQIETKSAPPVLKISLLGKFQLRIGDEKIPFSSWKSSKALMLFKYLASNREQGYIPKDFLLELLWPEGDPVKTGSRFNMAMSALRKTLEPGLPAKAPSAYIDRKKDTYRIVGDRCRVDTERFSALFSTAKKEAPDSEKALRPYLEALDLYHGEFLEEDRYEEWCLDKRHRFSMQYADTLRAVIRCYEIRKEAGRAIYYSQRLLEKSPLDEDAVFKLMQLHSQSGAASKVIETYENYTALAKQMNCPASEKISAFYKTLI